MFYIKFHIYELLFKAIIVTFEELLVMILKMLIYKIYKKNLLSKI